MLVFMWNGLIFLGFDSALRFSFIGSLFDKLNVHGQICDTK